MLVCNLLQMFQDNVLVLSLSDMQTSSPRIFVDCFTLQYENNMLTWYINNKPLTNTAQHPSKAKTHIDIIEFLM